MKHKDINDEAREAVAAGATKEEVAAFAAERISRRVPAECVTGEYRNGESPRPPFPVHALPDPVSGFVDAAAAAIGCAVEMVIMPMLACLAAAIGNTRQILAKDGWAEPSVAWTLVLAESGEKKSPAHDLVLTYPRQRDRTARERHQAAMERYRRDFEAYKVQHDRWKVREKKRREGDPSESAPIAPHHPVLERFLIADTTIEALAHRLQFAPRGLLLGRDELSGWIRGFDRYRSGRGGDCAQYLELHRAGSLTVDRKTGDTTTIYVPRAAVSITGGIQPRVLADALGTEHFENGLAARFLLAMPPRMVSQWSDRTIDAHLQAEMDHVFDVLYSLNMDYDAQQRPHPLNATFTQDGRDAFIDFYNTHGREQVRVEGHLAAAWAKMEAYALRLALIIYCVTSAHQHSSVPAGQVVDADCVNAAVTLVQWFKQETRRIYAALSESEQQHEETELMELVRRKGGRITANELRRCSRRYKKSSDATEALQLLVDNGYGAWATRTSKNTGGRPTKEFVLGQAST